jgi:pyruvate/2-oxoacid:ferredoxin oxidoreductase alpha subunit
MRAVELADKDRNPAIVLSDGYVGQMIEAVDFPTEVRQPPPRPWSVGGTAETRKNLVTSIYIYPPELEAHIIELQKKYREVAANEIRWDTYRLEGAEMILVGYGISSRVLRSTIDLAREEGIPAGLFRPISLWPYPSEALRDVAAGAKQMLVVELSNGQMLEDVRLAVEGRCPVEFYGRAGGIVPSHEEVLEQVKCLWEGGHVRSVI